MTTTRTRTPSNTPSDDPIVSAVTRALAAGSAGYDNLHQAHMDSAATRGATLITAGLATTRNAAMAPITLDTDAIIVALGGTPASATADATAQAAASVTANASATTQQTTPQGSKLPWMALGSALVAFIVGALIMSVIGETALGDADWVNLPVVVLAGLLAAIATGLIVWGKTTPTTIVRQSNVIVNPPAQAAANGDATAQAAATSNP